MGCIFCHRHQQFAISLIILLISASSHLRLFNAEGRKLTQTAENSKRRENENKAILRGQIGSRPPRCDRRCSTCGHCEAIQVPTNPQITGRQITKKPSSSAAVIAYARGDDGNSNYKPMSWKCKCGNLIFNP